MLFAVHPIMSEAVGYASGRSDVLCGAFFLGAFLTARRWMLGRRTIWWFVTVLLWTAALASKEIGAMFPFVLFVYDRWLLDSSPGDRRYRLLRLHLPLIGSAVAVGALRIFVFSMIEHPGETVFYWRYLLVDLDVVRRYLGLIALPEGQTIFHAVPMTTFHDPRAFVSIAIVLSMIALAWRLRRSEPQASLGLVWFLLLLVPPALLVLLDRAEPMAEHRAYIGAAGLFIAVGTGVGWMTSAAARLGRRLEAVLTVLFVVIVLSLAGRTVLRNAVWGSAVALWEEARDRAPEHWLPHLLLGEALHAAGRDFEAVAEYSESLQRRPDLEFTYRNMGVCLIELREFDRAKQLFEQLRHRNPRSVTASLGLGAVASAEGDAPLARRYYLEALGNDAENISARQSLALLDESEPANPAEALQFCKEIRLLAPATPGNDECIERNERRLAGSRTRQ
jgi:tetratricopeptide (TPR) repeat protein